MNTPSLILQWVVAVIICVSPALPFGLAALLFRHRSRRVLFVQALLIQSLSIVPFGIHVILRREHAEHFMILPMLGGAYMAVAGVAYLITCTFSKRCRRRTASFAETAGTRAKVLVSALLFAPAMMLIIWGFLAVVFYRPTSWGEPVDRLDDIQRAVQAKALTCELPASTVITPPTPCCSFPDHLCPPSPEAWTRQPGWASIKYSITEPTRFQFQLSRKSPTQLVISCYGDVDCNGTYAIFQTVVPIEHDGDGHCSVGSRSFKVQNETE